MKARLWILLALAALAILATGAPVFRDTGSGGTSHKSATQIFATILHDSYAGFGGFHACLAAPTPHHDFCWAELHRGDRYRLVGIDVDLSQGNPLVQQIQHLTWTRRPNHIASPEGHGSANTLAYGWEALMRDVANRPLPSTYFAVDGGHAGFPREMFAFRCAGAPTRISCRNTLGDTIAFTPTNL